MFLWLGSCYAVAVAGGGSRHSVLSRNMAQQRTNSFRANATIACFLRVFWPRESRCIRRWAHGLTQQDPSRFDQHLPQQRRPSATDAASAIGLARLKLFGHQSCIRRDLTPILKSLWVVQVGHDHLRRTTSNAGDTAPQLDALVRCSKRFELAFHFAQQLGDSLERLELERRFAAPQLVRRTLL